MTVKKTDVAEIRADKKAAEKADTSPEAYTPVELLDQMAAEQMTVIGFHLPGGGIGRVEAAETGYRFVEAG